MLRTCEPHLSNSIQQAYTAISVSFVCSIELSTQDLLFGPRGKCLCPEQPTLHNQSEHGLFDREGSLRCARLNEVPVIVQMVELLPAIDANSHPQSFIHERWSSRFDLRPVRIRLFRVPSMEPNQHRIGSPNAMPTPNGSLTGWNSEEQKITLLNIDCRHLGLRIVTAESCCTAECGYHNGISSD